MIVTEGVTEMATSTKTKPKDEPEVQKKEPPTYKIRKGSMQLAAWPNINFDADGREFTTDSIKLERSWTDKDGNWHSSDIILREKDFATIRSLFDKYEQSKVKVG